MNQKFVADIAKLNQRIVTLNSSRGTMSPTAQNSLNKVEALSKLLTAKSTEVTVFDDAEKAKFVADTIELNQAVKVLAGGPQLSGSDRSTIAEIQTLSQSLMAEAKTLTPEVAGKPDSTVTTEASVGYSTKIELANDIAAIGQSVTALQAQVQAMASKHTTKPSSSRSGAAPGAR